MESTSPARSTADEIRNRATGAGVVDDPYPVLAELQAACPVHQGSIPARFGLPTRLAPGTPDGVYSVLSQDESLRVLRDHGRFNSSGWYAQALGPTIGSALIALDPPAHQRHRNLLQQVFSLREMARWEHDIVTPVVAGYVDPLVPRGRADLYAEVAAHVPMHVMTAALGLPVEDQQRLVDWVVIMTSTGEPMDARLAARHEFDDYMAPLIAERRATRHDDLLGLLLDAQAPKDAGAGDGDSEEPLSDDEVSDFIRLLVVAGASTVYRGFGLLLFGLLTHPDQMEALRADRSLVPQAIEEGLRWEQPLTQIGRQCTRDTEIAGVPVAGGSTVVVEVMAANHDPSVWDEPDRFDIFRPPKQHLTFGYGRHLCLGIHLARLELRVLLEQTLDKLPNLRFDPDVPQPHVTGYLFRMPTALPVVWDVGGQAGGDARA